MNNRSVKLNQLHTVQWDLLIIGGGITGAGIALDAASRGIKTTLVEKNDFASGTSSKSTKLVHGGLRYLKQLEFALVSEVGRERAIVHKNAPHLVIPEKMLMPLVKGGDLWTTLFISRIRSIRYPGKCEKTGSTAHAVEGRNPCFGTTAE